MTKELIIERTIKAINQLPEDMAKEIVDFAESICQNYEGKEITRGVQKMISESRAFDFLEKEEELYSLSDLKKVYHV